MHGIRMWCVRAASARDKRDVADATEDARMRAHSGTPHSSGESFECGARFQWFQRLVHPAHERVDELLSVAILSALDEVVPLLGHATLCARELEPANEPKNVTARLHHLERSAMTARMKRKKGGRNLRPKEAVSLLEGGAGSEDLVDEILHADDSLVPERVSDHRV
eukprot:1018337-Rhodomonas_salina.1